ncbi:proteinfarnesyltransferase/geranylgeranyltransferase type-1 subunit alpha, partial [Monoraphidium neglectum]
MEAGGACIPYSRRPEWADIEPLPPPPGDAGKVVSIHYAERHAEALGYFRAILAKGEKTARALDLTRQLISFNGADYTAWQWRWQCVEALGADVEEEMALT